MYILPSHERLSQSFFRNFITASRGKLPCTFAGVLSTGTGRVCARQGPGTQGSSDLLAILPGYGSSCRSVSSWSCSIRICKMLTIMVPNHIRHVKLSAQCLRIYGLKHVSCHHCVSHSQQLFKPCPLASSMLLFLIYRIIFACDLWNPCSAT